MLPDRQIQGGIVVASVKRARPTEKEIESAILCWLQYQPGLMALKINTGGVFDPKRKVFRTLNKYVRRGTPDILICMTVSTIPVFIGMEVKSATGSQSPDQKDFEDDINRINGFYFLVRSVEQAEAAINTVRTRIQARLLKLKYS